MTDFSSIDNVSGKGKGFWKRPEGVTGSIFLVGILGLMGFLVATNLGTLISFASSLIGLAVSLLVLGAIIYMVLDPKMRALVSYGYKGIMRKITSIFVTIDPIGILKSYVEDLEANLRKMGKQIGELRGQSRKLKTMITDNNKEIEQNLLIARKAKEQGNQKAMLLSTRKAARLKDTNAKYAALHSKIGVLYKVLSKMYTNSEILVEDTKDQVRVKEQERKAIRASHSAMKSAMSVINGDADKRAMFDQSLEVIADDVANKVGEMEQFMEMSSNFMSSVDLQNGVFEEQGLKMLAEYEKKSTLLLLGGAESREDILDLDMPEKDVQYRSGSGESESYDNLFE